MPRKSKTSKKQKAANKRGSGSFSLVFFGLGALVVIFVVGGYLLLSRPYSANILSTEKIASLVNASTVQVPLTNTTVKLQNGNGEFTEDETKGALTLSEPYFSVKTKDGFDIYTVMTINYGGSGDFVYIGLFEDTNNTVSFKEAYPLEDRIKVTEINGPVRSDSGEYSLEVDYLGRPDDAPMSDAPTVLKTVKITVKDHKFSK